MAKRQCCSCDGPDEEETEREMCPAGRSEEREERSVLYRCSHLKNILPKTYLICQISTLLFSKAKQKNNHISLIVLVHSRDFLSAGSGPGHVRGLAPPVTIS